MNQNYFTFENKVYKQTFGQAMGNTSSPLLANRSLNSFENKITINLKFPKFWCRYVDDILAIVEESFELIKFTDFLNSQYPSIVQCI